MAEILTTKPAYEEVVQALDGFEQRLELGLIARTSGDRSHPADLQLRLPECNVAAPVTAAYLNEQGIEAHCFEGGGPLFDQFNPQLRHTITVVETLPERTVVDPTYSQFLAYFGIDAFTAMKDPAAQFTEDKILVFPVSEHLAVAEWLAGFINRSRERIELDAGRHRDPSMLRGVWDLKNYAKYFWLDQHYQRQVDETLAAIAELPKPG